MLRISIALLVSLSVLVQPINPYQGASIAKSLRLSSMKAVVYKPSTLSEINQLNSLAISTTVFHCQTNVLADLIVQVRNSLSLNTKLKINGDQICLYAIGPLLDNGDNVGTLGTERVGNNIVVNLFYTNIRSYGVKMRRNVKWRPLVQVPLKLDPGSYDLVVNWFPKNRYSTDDRFHEFRSKVTFDIL